MKKQKQTRETGAAYRVARKTRASKPRRATRRTRAAVQLIVPWEERIAPTDEQVREWDAWLNEHEPEFEKKYPGYYLAIWDKQVIARALSRRELYHLADLAQPKAVPLITYVPRKEEAFLAPSNFPAEWIINPNGK